MVGDLTGVLGEDRDGWCMTGQAPYPLLSGGLGLNPQAEDGSKHRGLEGRPMEERRIDPPEGLEIGRLLPHPLPFFIMPVMTLLTALRPDEDVLDLLDPCQGIFAVTPLSSRTVVVQRAEA